MTTMDTASDQGELHSRGFEFVTISNPKDIKNRTVQQRIRKHAGKAGDPFAKRRRTSKVTEPPHEIAQSFSQSALTSAGPSTLQDGLPVSSGGITQDSQSTRLLTLETQPQTHGLPMQGLSILPIEYDVRNTILVEYLFEASKIHFAPMCKIWLGIALTDSTAFTILLSGAAILVHARKNKDTPESVNADALRLYSQSLKELQARLDDPTERLSEGAVCAVAAFACSEASRGNRDGWLIHMRGLKGIIEDRGGMESMSSSWLRLSLHEVDVNASLLMDSLPVLDPPFDLQLPKSNFSFPLLPFTQRAIISMSDSFADLSQALELLGQMSGYLLEKKHELDQWKHEVAYVRVTLPVTYQLFGILMNPIPGDAGDQLHVVRNIIRLACLLYLALVKQRFAATRLGISELSEKLSALLNKGPIDWPSSIQPFVLWLHVILATATIQIEQECQVWVTEITSLMRSLGLTWMAALLLFKGILWTEGLVNDELVILERLICPTASLEE